jgi:hypothetical protein
MAATDKVTVTLVNSSNFTIDLAVQGASDDWESQPKFPSTLGQFTIDSTSGEAYYYRKTAPLKVVITIGGVVLSFTHDPYNQKNQFGQEKIDNGFIGYVCAQQAQYDFQIVIWSTQHALGT